MYIRLTKQNILGQWDIPYILAHKSNFEDDF